MLPPRRVHFSAEIPVVAIASYRCVPPPPRHTWATPCPPACLQNGVGGLIVGGTTGEGQLMSWDEHIMLIAHTGGCLGLYLVNLSNVWV